MHQMILFQRKGKKEENFILLLVVSFYYFLLFVLGLYIKRPLSLP